jgi:hypothetical protein
MFATLVAVLCVVGGGCVEEVVADSDTSSITFMSCAIGAQAGIAEWKAQHPIYRNDRWAVSKFKCVPGHYGKGV